MHHKQFPGLCFFFFFLVSPIKGTAPLKLFFESSSHQFFKIFIPMCFSVTFFQLQKSVEREKERERERDCCYCFRIHFRERQREKKKCFSHQLVCVYIYSAQLESKETKQWRSLLDVFFSVLSLLYYCSSSMWMLRGKGIELIVFSFEKKTQNQYIFAVI